MPLNCTLKNGKIMLPWQPVVRTTHSHCKGPEFNPTCHMTWQKRKKMAEMVNLLLCMVVVGGLVAQSCPSLEIPWTIAHQSPLSMGFSRWEYWSDLPFPSPGDLPDPGIKPRSPALQADSLLTELWWNSIYFRLYKINEQTKPYNTKQVDTENKLAVTTGEE